mgnify:CR=1 FL=1|jgi:hypothetical protein
MEFKGTQGYWKVVNETQIAFSQDDFNTKDCDLYEHQYDSFEELIANAKLIASAPDLLKELQKIKLDIDLGVIGVRKSSPIYSGIVNAINKALN